MDYINEVCQWCGEAFKEGDDIVVCPECGTPQHRECWKQHGHCVNSDKHSPDFVWTPQIKESVKPQEPIKAEPVNEDESVKGGIGTQITDPQQFEQILLGENINKKDEEFDSIKVSEAALYLQAGNRRYISKFLKQRDKHSKLSWNWGAFFFAPAWFFYRKLYKAGTLFLALTVALTLFTNSYAVKLYDISEKMLASISSAYDSNDHDAYEKLIQSKSFNTQREALSKGAAILALVTFILPNGVAALVANSFVKKKMKQDIEKVHTETDDPQVSKILIMQKGGTAPFLFCAVFFIAPYLASFLMTAAQWFIDIF